MTQEKKTTEDVVSEDVASEESTAPVIKKAKNVSILKDFFAEMDVESLDDSLESLLKVGAHFGHQASRRHPRMQPYIFGIRGTVTILDLEKTQGGLREAQAFLTGVRKSGKKILFVTTKRQMLDLIQSAAERCSEPYVVNRWIGGTFSNFSQIRRRVRSLLKMEDEMNKGVYKKYTKLEQLKKQEEIEKLNRRMGGLKKMENLPGAIVVIDVKTDALAVREARQQGIPVVAITDTNVDPTLVDYVIPANDDAISSVKLILGLLLKSVLSVTPVTPEKKAVRSGGRGQETPRARHARKDVVKKASSSTTVDKKVDKSVSTDEAPKKKSQSK